jgi:Domain of unknown function (DUF5103)
MKKVVLYSFLILFSLFNFKYGVAQMPDAVYRSNIFSIRLNMYGNQQALPVYNLGSSDQIELHFDDMEGNIKSYYYTYELCDYDWKPIPMTPFNYLKGFSQMRITNYRYSSIALTKYTHYQAILPDRNCVPSLSGNYLLKVFLDADTSKLVFTKRLLVVEKKADIVAQILQTQSPQYFSTHQKVQCVAKIAGLNSFSAAQQVKVVILQNNRWDNAQKNIAPTFIRGASLEYNSENMGIFAGGKEWRWLDLRSFRLQSDRVEKADYQKTTTDIFVKTDVDKSAQRYIYFRDLNGMYSSETYETINPFWQADYAKVHFSFSTVNGLPYPNENIYLAGQFTNFDTSSLYQMKFNEEKKMYEVVVSLKQGYYNYTFTLVDKKTGAIAKTVEGNYWETENNYTILMYYKAFADRADQLIGVVNVSSRTDRPGISF